MKIIESKPKDDSYYLPSENIKHKESMMIWPERTDNWRQGAKPAQKSFVELAKIISKYEPLTMFVSKKQFQNARQLLPNNVRVVEISNNDSWIKDIGPTFLFNKENNIRAVDWRFNAWGGLVDGLYFPWDMDDQFTQKICDLYRIDYYSLAEFVFEGCAYHTDGEGTLIVTEETVLSEGRNKNITKDAAEIIFKEYLNIDKVIWLKHGYFMDETNGDVDNMLNIVRPGEILLTWTEDRNDPQYQISQEAFEILNKSTDAKGRKFKIHKVMMPAPLLATEDEANGVDPVNGLLPRIPGDRLTASYVNYYLLNNAVIIPVFNDPNDELAIEQISKMYPDKKVETILAREFLLGGGNIHCVVMAMPEYQEV